MGQGANHTFNAITVILVNSETRGGGTECIFEYVRLCDVWYQEGRFGITCREIYCIMSSEKYYFQNNTVHEFCLQNIEYTALDIRDMLFSKKSSSTNSVLKVGTLS
jgi:hypothetical protein